MRVSVFDIFKIGIGPSSSHTNGPMKAACRFVQSLKSQNLLFPTKIKTVQTDLFGSLALTGKGHCTDSAVMLGLMGYMPDEIDTQMVPSILHNIEQKKTLNLGGQFDIPFTKANIAFKKSRSLPYHSNGMKLYAFDSKDEPVFFDSYYSIGGGFILSEAETQIKENSRAGETFPHNFSTAKELLDICERRGIKISQVMRENERSLRSDNEIDAGLDRILNVMDTCIANGIKNEGMLPGILKVERRAAKFLKTINEKPSHPFYPNKWLCLYALAVNEENASGGRVVTAPTNGAAGIVPSVLKYYQQFFSRDYPDKYRDFLLTAAAIGILFKRGATFSGAEGGCQAEVGVACSMAAAGLTEALGGSIYQIENAAEIGIEHNLGLTCDPIAGLVQIPCIERNAMGAVKAVNAATLALSGNGKHTVFLDSAIRTMKEIGNDMKKKYKETSLGGLAKTYKEDHHTDTHPDKKDSKKFLKTDHHVPEC